MMSDAPESHEERGKRLLGAVRRVADPASGNVEASGGGRLPELPVLARRIADRYAAARPDLPSAAIDMFAHDSASAGLSTANLLARADVAPHELSGSMLGNLEAVIRVSGRPAWFVREEHPVPEDDPLSPDDEFWITMIGNAGDSLRDLCGRVGCIFKDDGTTRIPVGTGWLIGERTLMTNAHVATLLTFQRQPVPATDARGGWRMRPDVTAWFDFVFENGGPPNPMFQIANVLYVEASQNPDLAVFRLDSAAPSMPGIDLAMTSVKVQTNVFAVGHPIADENDDPNVAIVFGKLDGTKRFSPGKIIGVLADGSLAHDCSTTNGSSGSPLIDFASMKAIGLHYFGKPGDRNKAVQFSTIAGHPALVKIQSGNWGV